MTLFREVLYQNLSENFLTAYFERVITQIVKLMVSIASGVSL